MYYTTDDGKKILIRFLSCKDEPRRFQKYLLVKENTFILINRRPLRKGMARFKAKGHQEKGQHLLGR